MSTSPLFNDAENSPVRPRRSAIRTALTVALVAAAAAASAVLSTGTANAQTATSTQVSSVTWPSGVFAQQANNTAGATAFGTYRGDAAQVALVYASRDSWSDFSTNVWNVNQNASFPGKLVVGVPLTIGSATLAQVAAGTYDSYFTTYAQNLKAAGRGDSFIRIGWEFNGNWMPWSAYDPATYIAAFRRVSTIFKTAMPASQIDWNGNWGNSQSGNNPFTTLYPGDAYVDVVGLDAYDGAWIPANTDAAFAVWQQSPFGIQDWINFAEAHGKKFSVPEWGLMPDGGGDNAAFIRGMYNFFTVNSDEIAYESYFNGLDNSLYAPVTMSAASAQYQSLWSQMTTVTNGSTAPAAVSLTVSGSTDVWGVNHVLSVGGLSGAATGTVTYTTGSTALCSASIVNGTAPCKAGNGLAAGSYPLTATYSGDSRFAAGTVTSTLVVAKKSLTPTLGMTATSITAGKSNSLSMAGLPGTATETVTFKSGSQVLCSTTPVGGRAHCSTATTLAKNTYTVIVGWPGNSQFLSATATGSFTVN